MKKLRLWINAAVGALADRIASALDAVSAVIEWRMPSPVVWLVDFFKRLYKGAVDRVFAFALNHALGLGIVTVHDAKRGQMRRAVPPDVVRGADIQALVDSLAFHVHRVPGTNRTEAFAILPSGFVVATGFSSCVSAAKFDPVRGRETAVKYARERATAKLWEFEGYVLAGKQDTAATVAAA